MTKPHALRRVIVGFDGSEGARSALTWAMDEARLHDAPLVAVTVQEGQPQAPVRHALLEKPDPIGPLRSAVGELTQDYPAVFRFAYDHQPARALVAACGAQDLLVVGTRGRALITRTLLGSVSRECIAQASGPVVVVPPDTPSSRHYGRVICGFDETEEARHALRVAGREALLRRAQLDAVHAAEAGNLKAELLEATNQHDLRWGRDTVDHELADIAVDVQPMIHRGHAPNVLVSASQQADLLVLGSRRRSPMANLVHGSVSNHCTQYASCPVMVVH